MPQARNVPPSPATRLRRVHTVLRLLLWTALAVTAAFMLFILEIALITEDSTVSAASSSPRTWRPWNV